MREAGQRLTSLVSVAVSQACGLMPFNLAVSMSEAMIAQLTPPPRPKQPHNARSLGQEVEVLYPFHPLYRRPAIVVANQLHNGSRHLTLRSADGASFLVPAWMIDPEAASVKIVGIPCISIARLRDPRAFLDSGLAFGSGEQIPEGGFDGEPRDKSARGFVRRPAAGPEAGSDGAGEAAGAASIAVDGSDCNDGSAAGGGR